MKQQKIYNLLSLVFLVAITACKKDKGGETQETIYPNYSELKVGNYWVYQEFNIDTAGTATALNIYDSCYVEKDTVINAKTYYKVYRSSIVPNYSYTYLRDSLHYVINSTGEIIFSSQDFNTVFESRYVLGSSSDTICHVTKQMADANVSVSVPSGTYTTLNSKETFTMYPNWTFAGNPRYINVRYAENIGIVTETLAFFSSDPNYKERRLVRYHLN